MDEIFQDEQLLQSSLFSFWFSARPPKAGSNVCVDRQSSSSLLGLFFQLSITIRQHPIRLGFFVLFRSIFPSITVPVYSSESPLSVCPIYLLCLFLIVCIRDLSSPIIASTSSFPICSVQLFFCILLNDNTSKASSHFVSSYFMILDPEPYSTTLHIVVLSSASSEFC